MNMTDETLISTLIVDARDLLDKVHNPDLAIKTIEVALSLLLSNGEVGHKRTINKVDRVIQRHYRRLRLALPIGGPRVKNTTVELQFEQEFGGDADDDMSTWSTWIGDDYKTFDTLYAVLQSVAQALDIL